MTKYTKYLTDHIFIAVTAAGFLLGGHWLWLGVVFVVVSVVAGDAMLGDHGERPDYRLPQLLTLILYSYLPAMLLLAVIFIWTLAPGDLFGIGAIASSASGYDVFAARAGNSVVDFVGAALGLGLMFAIINTVMAYVRIHRTWDPVAMFFGRWYFALCGGIPFETEHVYGHHITLGQPHDASLSLRKDSYWKFYSQAPFKQIVFAWDVEKQRLAKYGHSVFWPSNKMIRSTLRVVAVWSVVFLLGGWLALGMYTLAFWISKMVYEAIGYQFHHGKVCAPGERWEEQQSDLPLR